MLPRMLRFVYLTARNAALHACAIAACLAIFPVATSAAGRAAPVKRLTNAERASTLYQGGLRRLTQDGVEDRRAAVLALEEAVRLVPGNGDYLVALGRAQDRSGYNGTARLTFQRAVALAPDSPEAYAELGAAWKREWLKYLEPSALDSTLDACRTVTRLRPYSSEAWLTMVPLLFEHRDLEGAGAAADRAVRLRPGRADAATAAAYMAFRRGDLERADSLFRVTLPHLAPGLRALFDDITPVARDALVVSGGW